MTGPSDDAALNKEHGIPLSDEDVGAYLARNPDFLARNPEVLQSMMAPSRWSDDSVADIQQFMLEQLRGEIDNLRECAQDLIDTSRTNMSVQTRTHTAVLALLSATSFSDMLQVIENDLPLLLDIDTAVIGFGPPPEGRGLSPELTLSSVRHYQPGAIGGILGPDRDVALLRQVDDDGTVFGETAGLVHSAALARLRPGRHTPEGLIALGSRGSVFYPGQGTEMIGFLARVLERCIDRWHTAEN